MRKINEIIVHATATPPSWWSSKSTKAKVNEIRRWHVEDRKWRDIGYHYLIDRDGTIAPGRDVDRDGNVDEEIGAHVRGHNANSIGISLFGGHGSTENDAFEDNFTPAQDKSLRELIADLQGKYDIKKVSGHNEYAAKACPGFKVGPWLAEKAPRGIAGSNTLRMSAMGVSGAATAAGAAVGSLDGTTQIIVVSAVCVAGVAFLFIARERIKAWARGVR